MQMELCNKLFNLIDSSFLLGEKNLMEKYIESSHLFIVL